MRILASLFVVLALAVTAVAQRATANSGLDRKLTNLVVQSDEALTLASVSIQYGQSEWRPEYGAQLESLKGTNYVQLGKGFWTSLNTIAAVEIGGVKLAAGCYFLGLRFDADGGLHLLAFDAVDAMANALLPGTTALYTGEQKPVASMPLDFPRKHSKQVVPLLTIELAPDEKDAHRASLTIRWGNEVAQAPVALHFVEARNSDRGRK